MYGAILGDLAGSVVEFEGSVDPDLRFWTDADFFTDDTVLTVALADALLNGLDFGATLRRYTLRHPGRGYGNHFLQWAQTGVLAIESCGNGAPMRVSPVAYAAATEDEVRELARRATEPSHPHPQGLETAEFVALAIFRARHGATRADVLASVPKHWPALQPVKELRAAPKWEALALPTTLQALACLKDADSLEEVIRNAVSIGGDADTVGAIAGSLAEPIYGITPQQRAFARGKLHPELLAVLDAFEAQFIRRPG